MKRLYFFTLCSVALVLTAAMIPASAYSGLRVTAYSGTYMWYSGRGMSLTNTFSQEFPIPGGGATLTFMSWYDIQPHYDYGYVAVSTDGGSTWTALEGNITTTDDPNSLNIGGYGVTGKSGGWVSASFDLSAYAGQSVLLMFIYITDGTVNHAGWAVDEIAISEVGFYDDVESGSASWTYHRWNVVDGFFKSKTKDTKIGPPSTRMPRKIGP